MNERLLEEENSKNILNAELKSSKEMHELLVKEMDKKMQDLQGRNIVGFRDTEYREMAVCFWLFTDETLLRYPYNVCAFLK